jgi:hypothetical protein
LSNGNENKCFSLSTAAERAPRAARLRIHIIPRTPRLFLAALCAVHTNDYCTKPCRLLEILFSSGAEISELCIVWPCVFSCRAWQFIFHVRFNAVAIVYRPTSFQMARSFAPAHTRNENSLARSHCAALFQRKCGCRDFIWSMAEFRLIDCIHQISTSLGLRFYFPMRLGATGARLRI